MRYVFNVYSSNKFDKVTCETEYKPVWQLKQELEKEYRETNKIKGNIILECIAVYDI